MELLLVFWKGEGREDNINLYESLNQKPLLLQDEEADWGWEGQAGGKGRLLCRLQDCTSWAPVLGGADAAELSSGIHAGDRQTLFVEHVPTVEDDRTEGLRCV